MTEPYLMHFVVRKVTFTTTATGYIVTCYTNYPCHLWKRETTTTPQKHVHPVIVRGAPVGTYIDQCFVVYTDIEQQEPGDTFTHTFIQEPWPACETRWFYFWGTVGGVVSPSASAIFSQRRIGLNQIYSDPSHGLKSCDGQVCRTYTTGTWTQMHDGPGMFGTDYDWPLQIVISGYTVFPYYDQLFRSIMTFDLTEIPPGVIIHSAKYYMNVYLKQSFNISGCSGALYEAWPINNNRLLPIDYQNIGTVPMSDKIHYEAFPNSGWCNFTLNTAGLALLKPGEIVRFGLREASYDAPNIAPGWGMDSHFIITFHSVDTYDPTKKPYLEILYECPPL